ncbi:hypothetical protein AHiyo8_12040 [Arthrobacter sp. Hiyo8]|nr:hypothetical protein AHiyo8_12040 [Arthrobacter sp. Hiyo8]
MPRHWLLVAASGALNWRQHPASSPGGNPCEALWKASTRQLGLAGHGRRVDHLGLRVVPGRHGIPRGGANIVRAATASASPAQATASTAASGASAAVGSLVPGFPQQLIPLMPKAAVESSSFDKNSSPASVALVGTIASPSDAVVAFYTSALTAQGFKEVPEAPWEVSNQRTSCVATMKQ